MRAARVHEIVGKVSQATWQGAAVTELLAEWRSDLVVGSAAHASASLAGWDPTVWGLDVVDRAGGSMPLRRAHVAADLRAAAAGQPAAAAGQAAAAAAWGPLCEKRPRYNARNATLFRTIVTGAEDPKLLPLPEGSVHGRYGIAFSSYPPQASIPHAECHHGPRAVYQMYLAAEGEAAAAGDLAHAARVGGPGCGWTRLDEKNWVGFTRRGQLHFVYSVHPHTVVLARAADGVCATRYSTSSYAPVAALAAQADALKLHGSATALPWRGDQYLALFHTVSVGAGASGAYTSFAYTFSADPPFAITSVSRALPLAGGARAFVSGLALPPDSGKVVVSYGYANQEARALVMSEAYFDELFQNASQCGADDAT